MHRRHLTFLLIAMAVLGLATPGLARADEADNFTCRNRLSRDSLVGLDGWVNARIAEAIDRANQRGAGRCDAACLRRELQATVGRSVRQPVTLVPHSSFVRWIKKQKDIERCHLRFSETIYGARRYDQAWLFPFNGRIIFVADSIRLSGHVVGIDKIDHFIREGLVHWRRTVSRPSDDIAASIARELGPPRRQFRWTEYGLKGMSLTGVLSYADLAAGYFGYRFWSDLLSMEGPESFVEYDASGARFVQRRPFTFAAYVNEAWDESINCSTFHPTLAREVALALQRRSMTCPGDTAEVLAALPDARLYVNPAQLANRGRPLPAGARRHEYHPRGRIQRAISRNDDGLGDAKLFFSGDAREQIGHAGEHGEHHEHRAHGGQQLFASSRAATRRVDELDLQVGWRQRALHIGRTDAEARQAFAPNQIVQQRFERRTVPRILLDEQIERPVGAAREHAVDLAIAEGGRPVRRRRRDRDPQSSIRRQQHAHGGRVQAIDADDHRAPA